ncbi:MFS transporter [Aeromicrobium choanae]|uniref:Major Facilitator Superfamily protein n=1 Tax=Aeromicrobium choanae TaxID=1736691 RepID=A0A1T4Z3L2_9ACTN|nr:MFS transporter [Aeromicrobium choanae]SKB08453.1 Major Facilitator Superfamily protein [Aeromicrobium choanae]
MTTQILGLPSAAVRTLALGFLARVPAGALGLVIVLHGLSLGLSYTVSGLMAAAFALGMAVGAPVVGRSIDRWGQPVPLFAVTVVAAAMMIGLTSLPQGTGPAAPVALAAITGLTQPPLAVCARAIWNERLGPVDLSRMLSLDASLQEMTYILGPLTVVSWATVRGTHEALILAAGLILVLTAVFALTPESRRASRRSDRPVMGAPSRFPVTVWILVVVTFTVGIAIGVLEVAVVRRSAQLDASELIGVFYGLWATGSLVGGLINLRAGGRGRLASRMTLFLAALALTHLVVAAATTTVTLGLALVLAGLPAAPMFAAFYELLGTAAPEGRVTEVFAWGSTGGMAGVALGTATGGFLADVISSRGNIVVCAAVLGLAAVFALACRSPLTGIERR